MKLATPVRAAALVGGLLVTSVPAHAAVTFDATGSNNGYPFNIGAFGLSSQAYQQVYGAAGFAGPVSIVGLRFQLDQSEAAFSTVLSNVEISLSTTAAGPSTLGSLLDGNIGTDRRVVRNGPLPLSSGGGAFDVSIPFTTPFAYDPAQGSLLMHVRNFGDGQSAQFEAGSNPLVGRLFTAHAADAFGTAEDGFGLATRFTTVAAVVPEPGAYLLMALGLAVTGFVARRRG